MAEPGKCRSCGADILWCKTVHNLPTPLDREPHPEGNIVLVDGVATVVKNGLFEEVHLGDKYRSHYASCPDAEKWRKKK